MPPTVDPAMIPDMLLAVLRSMRPRQWAKNVFVFAALAFDVQLLSRAPLTRTIAGFFVLCLASGTVYLINDLADLEKDRVHPVKRNRPLASGALSPRAAIFATLLLAALTAGASLALAPTFAALVLLYIVINVAYSFLLKHVPIVDVLVVASGFVLRVGAGVTLIQVERFSPWLYVCTTLLALLIGFGKRRAELTLLSDAANSHRRVLDGYTVEFLDQLIVIVSGTTIIAYALYTFSADNLPGNHLMMLTIPFVIYGIFRYLYLIHVENLGGAPEELVLTDRPLMASIVFWGLFSLGILYLA